MLVGYDGADKQATVEWSDTWHMSGKVMRQRGSAGARGIDVRGSYPAPPGPDWGWCIAIKAGDGRLRIAMYHVAPERREARAMAMSPKRR